MKKPPLHINREEAGLLEPHIRTDLLGGDAYCSSTKG